MKKRTKTIVGIACSLLALAVISPTKGQTVNAHRILCIGVPTTDIQVSTPPQHKAQAWGVGFNEVTQQNEVLTIGWAGTSCTLHTVSETTNSNVPTVTLPFGGSFWEDIENDPMPTGTLQCHVSLQYDAQSNPFVQFEEDPTVYGAESQKDFPFNSINASLGWFMGGFFSNAHTILAGLPKNYHFSGNFVFIVIPAS